MVAPVPYAQRPGLVWSYVRWQPSWTCLGLSPFARASGGSRLAGTAVVATPAVTARATRSASVSVGVALADAVAVGRASAGAACAVPVPFGSGSVATVPNATTAANAVSPAPRARLRRVPSRVEKRTGFSTSRSVTAAGARQPTARTVASPTDDGSARIRTGKCQRYQEYDSRPSSLGSGRPSGPATPWRVVAQPATTTAAVPRTGSAAAAPGNAVLGPYVTTAVTMAARPSQPSAVATLGRRVLRRGAASATSPPTPSSHARVGSEKNAHARAASVSQTQATNDTATTPSSAETARRLTASVARSSGQTT